MANNLKLNYAKEAKNDEFYTQLVDIENELRHYKPYFRGKTVLCNCDDPRVSNFFKYFTLNFEYLGLNRLIATCYKHQSIDLFSQNDCEQAVYIIYEGDKNGNHIPEPDEMEVLPLKGDGDFRSDECIELLKSADIVCTNPPFSLFREYIAQLVRYDKKFLIIGSINAISYKEVFPLLKDGKVWLGCSIHSGDREFEIPEWYHTTSPSLRYGENGRRYVRVPGIRWFTNLDYKERHEELILYKHYSSEEYIKYDNYDAINVDRISDIPCDYDGIMGVPLNLLDVFNPDQFEIIGYGKGDLAKSIGLRTNHRGRSDLAITVNGKHTCPYGRILIKKKQ